LSVNYQRNPVGSFTKQRITGHSTLEITHYYAEISDSVVEIKQKAPPPAEELGLEV